MWTVECLHDFGVADIMDRWKSSSWNGERKAHTLIIKKKWIQFQPHSHFFSLMCDIIIFYWLAVDHIIKHLIVFQITSNYLSNLN